MRGTRIAVRRGPVERCGGVGRGIGGRIGDVFGALGGVTHRYRLHRCVPLSAHGAPPLTSGTARLVFVR